MNTFIPTILLLIGIVILAFPLAARIRGKIKLSGRGQIFLIGIGVLLALIGISLYLIPAATGFTRTSAPTVLGVTIRARQEPGGLVYDQEINFYDEDGNTERVERELIDLSDPSQGQFIQLQNGVIDVLPEIQMIRATVTETWRCDGHIYVATIAVTLIDRDSNRSRLVRYKIDCK